MSAPELYVKAGALARAAHKVETASRRLQEATDDRDDLIRDMIAAGCTLRGVAQYAGLSHTAIAKICDREER